VQQGDRLEEDIPRLIDGDEHRDALVLGAVLLVALLVAPRRDERGQREADAVDADAQHADEDGPACVLWREAALRRVDKQEVDRLAAVVLPGLDAVEDADRLASEGGVAEDHDPAH
jgi:hypothetical protein